MGQLRQTGLEKAYEWKTDYYFTADADNFFIPETLMNMVDSLCASLCVSLCLSLSDSLSACVSICLCISLFPRFVPLALPYTSYQLFCWCCNGRASMSLYAHVTCMLLWSTPARSVVCEIVTYGCVCRLSLCTGEIESASRLSAIDSTEREWAR